MEHNEPECKSQYLFIRWVQQFRKRVLENKFGWLPGWLAGWLYIAVTAVSSRMLHIYVYTNIR
jgi:hypothetical protein